jgi:PKD repeat protein
MPFEFLGAHLKGAVRRRASVVKRTFLLFYVIFLLTAIAPVFIKPASAEDVHAGELAAAMGANPVDLINATFSVDETAGAVVYGIVGFLAPTEGDTFVMLSTGNAQPENFSTNGGWIGTPDDFLSVNNGNPDGTGPLGGNAHDIATLNLTLRAPAWAKSLRFDFRFMSEEYPEFVGSNFNDFFSCLLDGTNIAFDTEGNIINVNNNFFDNTTIPEGTVFDGTTVLLTSKAAVTGGATFELDFIVGDISDSSWDTAVFLDNLGFSTEEVEEPVTVPTIWSSDSFGNEKNTFAPTDAVYVAVPATGKTVTFYIVADKNVWNGGDPLTDASDGAEQLTLNPGPGIQVVQVWASPQTSGSYDVVEDANNNGIYDAGVDGVDSVAEIGFVIETPPVNNPPYQPQLSLTPSLAVEDNDDLVVSIVGPTPADPDGDSVTYTYRWFVDVGTGSFVDDEAAGRGEHLGNTVPAADTIVGDIWRVEVKPTDEHGVSGTLVTADWQIVVDATKPVANAGPDRTVNEDTQVTFDGSASTDNVGIATYVWTFTDGTLKTLTGRNPTYVFANPGTYTVTLNVTDAAGNWATDTVVVTASRVIIEPQDVTKPVAKAGSDKTAVEGKVANFDAGGSSDNVGIVSYEWNFGDGTAGTGKTVTHTYTEPGTYAVTLTVKDAAGNSNTASISVTIQKDTDGDGSPDVTDPDDDNDGVNDDEDAFPLDPTETVDTDDDGIGNNADNDDDNDGMPDAWETDKGLDPLDAEDIALDVDGDGLTSLQEYLQGKDPNAPDAETQPRQLYVVAVAVGAIAAATTAILGGLGSLGGLGKAFDSAISKMPIPEKVKEFLQVYGEKLFETVDKAKLEALENAPFISRSETVAFTVSALLTTIVFGSAEANGLQNFLNPSGLASFIPSALVSAFVIILVGELFEALCARSCNIYRQFKLWMYGTIVFLISGLVFQLPFGSPGITRYRSGEISNKTKGLLVLSKMLLLLALTIPFTGLLMLGFEQVGSIGLKLTLMITCFSLLPLRPLAGKAIFDYRKAISLTALAAAGTLFYSCAANLLPPVAYLAAGAVSAFLAVATLIQLRKAKPK